MTTGDGFRLNSGFTKILCTPEKPLPVWYRAPLAVLSSLISLQPGLPSAELVSPGRGVPAQVPNLSPRRISSNYSVYLSRLATRICQADCQEEERGSGGCQPIQWGEWGGGGGQSSTLALSIYHFNSSTSTLAPSLEYSSILDKRL